MAGTPPLRKLEYLLAVARELHITKAAERLHVDKSVVSREVKGLEEEFDFTVFNRANRRLVGVKEEAVEFLVDLEQALARFAAELERAIKLARLRARRKASSFVVGYTPFVVPTIPNEIRSVHSRRFPSIHLEKRRAPAQELIDSLVADACQLCVVLRPAGARYFEEIRLRSESLFAVWPRAYEVNHSGAIALVELRAHPLILPCSHRTDPILEQWFFDRCAAAGFKPKVAAEASTPAEAFNLVQDGVGIAIVPEGFCGDAPGALKCSPIDGLEPLQLVITYRRGASLPVQKMLPEIVRELDRAIPARVS
jgi:DNA-binding transcriptional LysR family regulator